MEVLAAVGLAGNVIQFVDFACKLFDQATSIYRSRSGASKGAQNLETVTKSLQDLSARLILNDNNRYYEQDSQSRGDQSALRKLAQECQAAADDLLSALHGLKAKDPSSKWSSFRAALCSTWRRPQVDDMEKRLNTYRSQLIIQLQVLQAHRMSGFLPLMDTLKDQSLRLGADMTEQISSFKCEVRSAIENLRIDLIRQEDRQNMNSQKGGTSLRDRTNNIPALARVLVRSEMSGMNMIISLGLLNSLTFDGMNYRHSKIHEAHPNTYTQVFQDKISRWLLSEEPVFWISGKPGSGKSTLMKYIANNPGTRLHLRRCLNDQEPIISSYFFWVNGTELQRSQEGLLRSILYGILRQKPDLIEIALPNVWESMTTGSYSEESSRHTWERGNLVSAIQRLANSGSSIGGFCILIDGLDEFLGDHDELIDTIRHLKTLDIKMCVASRPWNVFEEAFGKDGDCKIYLEDLNHHDIQTYVQDKLGQRRDFRDMQISALYIEELIAEIVAKSQGVFLWVFLVVRSLIEGLRNRDRISQLQKRLRDFPSDLEAFFGHMFQSIDPTYRTQTAHTFQVALAAPRRLSSLTYWFLDEQEDDPDMALSMELTLLEPQELYDRIEQMKIRINGRCKGLLEITTLEYSNSSVDFLHRTVKDFLMTTDIRRTCHEWQDPGFDPYFQIGKASLAELKSVATQNELMAPPLENILRSIFSSAKEIEAREVDDFEPYLKELQRVSKSPLSWDRCYVFSRAEFPNVSPWKIIGGDTFLEVAIEYDLIRTVRARLSASKRPRSENFLRRHLGALHGKRLSLEMISLLVSFGPLFEIDILLQGALVSRFATLEASEVLLKMRELLEHVYFATPGRGQFHAKLDECLRKRLPATEVEDLVQLNDLRQRASLKNEGRLAEEREKSQEPKRGLFRRFFRRMCY